MIKETKKTRSISIADKNAIFNILNECYKAGIRDAEYVDDVGRCREFIEETRKPGVYGRVIYNVFWDWKKWRSAIVNMRIGHILGDPSIFYTQKIISPTSYYACLLPLAQWFYHQGLNDWNANPTLHTFEAINNLKYLRWTRNGFVKSSRKKMFAQVQEFAFEIGCIGESSEAEGVKALKPIHFEWFCRHLWEMSLTRHDKMKLSNKYNR